MSSAKVILYDLPSKDQGGACWSLNPWKIRLALNYKGIDYETKWIEYPDVAPTLQSFGLSPGDDEDTPYTIPTVRFPDGTCCMDSKQIIQEIEKRFPEPDYPSLDLENPATDRAYKLVGGLMGPLQGVWMPAVPKKILTDVSAEYFTRTRESWIKMSLEDLSEQKGGEKAWAASKEAFAKVAEALNEKTGPFLLGDKVTYADIIIVSALHFLQRTGGEQYSKTVQEWPEIVAFHEAFSKWLKRDSY